MGMCAPPPEMTVSEWADANRVLESSASSEPGRWRTDRAPYQREIMDAFTEPGIWKVVMMSSAQVGKTEILLNVMGYFIDQDPRPILCMQPTLAMGEAFSKDRLAPMLDASPALKGRVGSPRSKDSNNTLLHKRFTGGHATICGANSPSSLASRPVSAVLKDELSRYPVSAGSEGDPSALADKRTATFHNRVIGEFSTPTVKGADRIEMSFETSDQRRYYVPCPECGTMQPMSWAGLKWAKDADGKWDRTPPWYDCDSCDSQWFEKDKSKLLKGGRWVAEGFAPGVAGFHLNELYSPWRKWEEMVEDFLTAKKDTELLRVFVNTSLGETFEESGEGVEPTGLFARREPYAAEVPAGVCVLVAGADVQDDRLEVTVYGFGIGEECWAIDHRIIHGDPAGDQVWADLDDIILSGRYKHEGGSIIGCSATCIDSGGHHTKRVYEYCKSRKNRRIIAIKGMGGFSRPVVSAPSRKRHGRDRRQIDLYTLGVDEIKSLVYTRLNNMAPGPGYIHFPIHDSFTAEWFEQLTAEIIKTKFKAGVPYRVWELPSGRRNEALDCAGYAYAALVLLNPNLEALAARLGDVEAPREPATTEQGPRKPRNRPVGRRTGFATGWK